MTRHLKSWFSSYGAALGSRDVRLLFGGLVVSTTGSWAYSTALAAFAYQRTHSLGWIGAVGLARFLPPLLFSPYAGVVVERTQRIRLLIGTNLLCVLWQCGLAAVVLVHGSMLLALAFAVLTALTTQFEAPAVGSTLPNLVPEGDLVAANALQSTIDNLVVILGPAVGAVLLLAGSPAIVIFINAGTFLFAAAMDAAIRHRPPAVDVTEGGNAGFFAQLGVGFKAIAGARSARVLIVMCALVSFLYGTDTVLFVGVSADKLGTGVHGYGYLLTGLGIGGLLMAGAVDKLAGRSRLAWVIMAGVAGYSLPTALLVVIHSPALAMAVQVFRGGSTLIVDVLALTALQRATPKDQLGRVMGVFFSLIIGSIALGTVITPAITESFGLDTGLVVMAFAPTVVAMLGLPALLEVDRSTAAASAALVPKVALLEQLGLFSAATRPLLERLASEASELEFAAGQQIIAEGEQADLLYVLADGSVQVTASGEIGGPTVPIRTMQAPTYFGEIGIIEHIPRTANVIAASACRCLAIDGATLLDALSAGSPSTMMRDRARSHLAYTHPSLRPAEEVTVAEA